MGMSAGEYDALKAKAKDAGYGAVTIRGDYLAELFNLAELSEAEAMAARAEAGKLRRELKAESSDKYDEYGRTLEESLAQLLKQAERERDALKDDLAEARVFAEQQQSRARKAERDLSDAQEALAWAAQYRAVSDWPAEMRPAVKAAKGGAD